MSRKTNRVPILLLLILLCVNTQISPVFADGTTTLTTIVPGNCTVTLDIGDNGSVSVDSRKYTGKAELSIHYGKEIPNV